MQEQTSTTQQTLKRRGLIAGAAALVVGIVAKQTGQSVAAASVPIMTETTTNEAAPAFLTSTGAGAAFVVQGVDQGVIGNCFGKTTSRGLDGETDKGIGVFGSASTTGIGVYGQGVTGTYGFGSATGLFGYSPGGTGVYGVTNATNQYGILGTTTATNSTAIAGIANSAGSSAFSGGTTLATAYAGVFQGNVVIQGKLVVSDPSYKSGALQHPDGSTRLVYCVESPESWIEDFGEGTLVGGTADIKFDADFAAVVLTDRYHVYITGHDETSEGLVVADRHADGFKVKESKGGKSNGTFSWRVVVKPKTTVKQERLAKFTMPKLSLPMPLDQPSAVPPQKKP